MVRERGVLALAIAGVLAVAAAPIASAQSEAPASGGVTATIAVGYPSDADAGDTPSILAINRLNEQGWQITPTFFDKPETDFGALAANQIQIGIGSTSAALLAQAAGAKYHIIGTQEGIAWLVVGKTEINSCDDLNGKRWALHSPAGVTTGYANFWVKANCSPDVQAALQPQFIQGSDNREAALLADQIDATLLDVGTFADIQQKAPGKFHAIADLAQDPGLAGVSSSIVAVNDDYWAQNPQVVVSFLKGMMQAYADAKADPSLLDAAAASQNVAWNDVVKQSVVEELESGALDPSLAITPEGMQNNITFYETNSSLPPGLTPDTVANFEPLQQAGGGTPTGSPEPSGAPASGAPAGSEAPAASPDQAYIDDVCQKGVAEGAVTVYIDIDQDLFENEIAPFKAAYPGIAVTQTAIRPTDSVPKVITNISAGQAPETDIVQGEAPLLDPLVTRGLIDTSYDWTKWGQPSDQLLNGLLRHYRVWRGLGYNTQTVQPEELPNTWEELVDPKWAGQVVVDPRGYTFQDLGVAWGEEKLLDYVTRLKATVNPLVQKGITDDTTAVASGQVKLNTNARDAETAENQAKGAPIDIKYLDYVIVDDSYNGVVKGAQHPNAAACLIGWMNSPEGLDLQAQNEFKHNDDTLSTLPAGATLVNIDTAEKATLDADVATKVAAIWAGQ